MWESLADVTWLYRGVPRESPEVLDVRANGELRPPRPDRLGERWRELHIHGATESGYTSWSTERSIAEDAGGFSSEAPGLSGEVVILRVAVNSIAEERVFPGLEDEAEFLIEGTVEGVSISTGDEDEENSDD